MTTRLPALFPAEVPLSPEASVRWMFQGSRSDLMLCSLRGFMKAKTASLASPIIYGVLLIIVTLVLTVLY
ncbi:hypothetical protein, partial [Enterobacter hormaechei]